MSDEINSKKFNIVDAGLEYFEEKYKDNYIMLYIMKSAWIGSLEATIEKKDNTKND